MTFIEFFKKQFTDEGATTRKMLARIPDGQFLYQPHAKSMNLKTLAMHLADLPGWVHMVLTTDELDLAMPYEPSEMTSTADLMAYFETRYNDGLSVLVPENEAVLSKTWVLRNGAAIYISDPKIEMIRISLSQQIHHRAQLGVYLRLLHIPIPGSYGPSADENDFD